MFAKSLTNMLATTLADGKTPNRSTAAIVASGTRAAAAVRRSLRWHLGIEAVAQAWQASDERLRDMYH